MERTTNVPDTIEFIVPNPSRVARRTLKTTRTKRTKRSIIKTKNDDNGDPVKKPFDLGTRVRDRWGKFQKGNKAREDVRTEKTPNSVKLAQARR